MRRVLIALLIVTGFALTAAPAVADEGTDGSTTATSSETTEPKAEDSPPPPEQTTPPAEETPPPAEETAPPSSETPGTEAPGTETPGTETPGTEEKSGSNQSSGSDQTSGARLLAAAETPLAPLDPPAPPALTDTKRVCTGSGSTYSTSTPTVAAILAGAGDIVPPFDYAGGHFDGRGLGGDGQAIYNNGCTVPGAPVEPVDEGSPEAGSVTICHANGSNSYDSVSIEGNSTAGGHDNDAGDIIPPFEYAGGSYPGKNFGSAGQAIFDNHCSLASALEPLIEIQAKKNKITICHSTSAVGNPYVTNQPDASGDINGHAGHTGGLFPTPGWGDIIPPFDFGPGAQFDGLNWPEGEAIYNNGCKPLDTPPDPEEGQVDICHATGSQQMPYVQNSPNANGTVSGHAGHTGGVFPDDPWGDIIPPFEFGDNEFFPGLNWDEAGMAIYFNGCVFIDVPDDECEEDCDDDDDDGDDDGDDRDEAALLPDTGGSSLWTLLMGGLLTVLGLTILVNRESMGRVGLSGPVPSDAPSAAWSYTIGRRVGTDVTAGSHRRWTALSALTLVAAAVLGRRARK